MNPLVSVIVPVYNVGPYINEALDSLAHQTYTNLEILLIDDGSTDGSGAICDKFACRDKRATVFHQKNQGQGAARNHGLDRMGGEYVAFLDPDDAYVPGMISYLMESIQATEADMAVCGFARCQTEGQMDMNGASAYAAYDGTRTVSSKEALRKLIEGTICHAPWNKLYKRELWKDIRFPEGYKHEDARTTYRILRQAGTIVLLDRILVKYRERAGSVTSTHSERNGRDWLAAMSELARFVEENTPSIFTESQRDRFWRENLKGIIVTSSYFTQAEGASYSILQKDEIMGKARDILPGSRSLGLYLLCLLYDIHPGLVRGLARLKRLITQHNRDRAWAG